jgi:hypothetical protein
MPQGLITSLLIKLTFDYWYFTLIALLLKLFIIRITAAENMIRAFLMWLIGSVAFYTIACLTGILFSSTGFYYTPFIMFVFACLGEVLFLMIMFRETPRKVIPSVIIGNGIFFTLLFTQML